MLRRGRLVVLSVAVGAATTITALPGQAGTLRTGLARAQLARVVPYVGIPSVGAGVGVAQAEVQGGNAHASAGVADFGMMSMILGAVASKSPVPLPELPGPITADDRHKPDVERNPLAPPAEVPAVPGAPAPAWEEAHASRAPESRARVRGPELGVPGVLTFTAGESVAFADGGVTSSAVTLDRLVLGGSSGAPEVVLSGLVWTARQAIGEPGTASFSVGSITVAGQALPIPGPAAATDALKTLNDALTPLGLRLEIPVSTADTAGAAVSSLVIQVRNPEPVANLVGQVTQPAVPVLNQMLDALVAAAPDAAASRLVINALLATGTTRGGGRLELGGASARIGNTEVADLTPPAPPELPAEAVELPAAFAPPPVPADPVAAPTTPPPAANFSSNFAAGPGYGNSSSTYESSLPAAAPPAPSGAARSTDAPASPDGSTVSARPVATTAPSGASAPLVLGAALLAIAVLALGDKLRLRRLVG